MKKPAFVIGLSVIGAASAVTAQTVPPPADRWVTDFERCQAIAAADQRLACLDAVSRRFVDAGRRRDIAVVDRAQLREAEQRSFGGRQTVGELLSSDGKPVEMLNTKVVRASELAYGRYLIEIDGGAKWRTTEAWSDTTPRAGSAITIRRGPLGSYILKVGNGRAVRAMRVG